MFSRYVLRTTDVDGARTFYGDVTGVDFSAPEATSGLQLWPLHEEAQARGAPSHWLGQITVDDVEKTASRLVDLGATRLGPTLAGRDGVSFASFRDPLGAVVGVREKTARPERPAVQWQHLHTTDVERAWAMYAELFGWRRTVTTPSPHGDGGLHMFAWGDDSANVGSVANTARLPGVHAHWLFFFPVTPVTGHEAALDRVRALGGKTLATFTLPNLDRITPCEDPQGAAFGLLSRRG